MWRIIARRSIAVSVSSLLAPIMSPVIPPMRRRLQAPNRMLMIQPSASAVIGVQNPGSRVISMMAARIVARRAFLAPAFFIKGAPVPSVCLAYG